MADSTVILCCDESAPRVLQIAVLAREVWRGVSARAAFAGEPPAEDKGINRVTAGLTFTRWDADRPADVDNLLLLTFDEVGYVALGLCMA